MGKNEGESFADLFAREVMPSRAKRLSVGDEVEGVVAHVGHDSVMVDLDAKQHGFFDRVDFVGHDGELKIKAGDHVKGRVLAIDREGEIKLGSALGKDASLAELRMAYEQGVPIEGKITAINKGGAEVEIAGQRAFCPKSQLDIRFVEDPSVLVGQVFHFAIVEMKDRNVVVSRRRVLERQAVAARASAEEKLAVGATMQGRVTQIREFGAFVDLGGIEGLVPLRELSYERGKRAEDVLTVGDVAHVKIMRIDKEGDRTKITLSLRALSADPWDGIDTIAPTGRVVSGQVTQVSDVGAFVRLAPGVEGLLHISELGTRVQHASERVNVGDALLLVVKEVDKQRKRISLALAQDDARAGEAARDMRPILGAIVSAKVEKHERFGVFVQIEGTRGRAGRALVPTAELGLRAGADVRKELPIGATMRAKVVDATDGRVRLSVKAAEGDAERADYDSYRAENAAKGGMGTLGDLLRAKLEK